MTVLLFFLMQVFFLSSIQRNLKIRSLQIDAAMSAHALLLLRTLMLNTLERAWSSLKVKY